MRTTFAAPEFTDDPLSHADERAYGTGGFG